MKNLNQYYKTFYIVGDIVDGVDIITMQYSQAGHVTAFRGWGDEVLARAGGSGYCKQSSALSQALSKRYSLDIGGACAGVEVVIKLAKEKGLTVYDRHDVSRLINTTNKRVSNKIIKN